MELIPVTAKKIPLQSRGTLNPVLCAFARCAAGAMGCVAAATTFAVQTGNNEAMNSAVLGGAAVVGIVGGVVELGIFGGLVCGAASIIIHNLSDFSMGGLTGMYNDALNGSAAPAGCVGQ